MVNSLVGKVNQGWIVHFNCDEGSLSWPKRPKDSIGVLGCTSAKVTEGLGNSSPG